MDAAGRQRIGYREAAERVDLRRHLRPWSWMLAGTPPLGIDVPGSDIDVICTVDDYDIFVETLWRSYAGFDRFCLWQWAGSDRPVIARFLAEDWEFEVFGSSLPLVRQQAVRHFEIEKRLLQLAGPRFRDAVRASKLAGQKTEPAFAKLLGLAGNPYDALLELEGLSGAGLVELLSKADFIAV